MRKLSAPKIIGLVAVFCFAVVASAQTFTTLATFDGTNGANPVAPLVQGLDGNLYGTTMEQGTGSYCSSGYCGTVFKMTRTGDLTTLHNFCDRELCADGTLPNAGLVLTDDGSFYGTTTSGGTLACFPTGCGTIFKITATGALSTIHRFCEVSPNCPDGANPYAGLVLASDGNLYGTTAGGGLKGGYGTVFRITRAGVLTTLHRFQNSNDGAYPFGGLIQATDGNLYGTTTGNARLQTFGTVFRITLAGDFTTLHSFSPHGPAYPSVPLLQANDGNFYGTTLDGGPTNEGTIYMITPEGSVTLLFAFCVACADGSLPDAPLIQATDGNLYGTTTSGGTGRFGLEGTIFMSVDPPVAVYSFCSLPNCNDGASPAAALLQATDGIFYGTTEYGPSFFGVGGTVFSFDTGLGPFVTFVRFAGKVGDTGPILGQGLTGTTSVSINGIEAHFTVVSDTEIRATVPAGATTGYVTVTTPTGVLTSNVPFHVIQ